MAQTKCPYRGVIIAVVTLLAFVAFGLSRDKSGTKEEGAENAALQVLLQPAAMAGQNSKTEKGGFEPPVQVYPVQQFSKLSP